MLPGRNPKSYLLRFRRASLRELLDRARQEYLFFRIKRPGSLARILPPVPEVEEKTLVGMHIPGFQGHIDPGSLRMLMEEGFFGLNGERQVVDRFEEESRGRFFAALPLGEGAPDIRMVWEPARLQHITALLFSSRLNGGGSTQPEAMNLAKRSLFDWIGKNPFPLGPHYISPMECGLRIPVFVYALKILNLSAIERREVLVLLHRHAWWISQRLSMHSSRGNHTVCECLGLVFAGMVFRSFPEENQWLSRGLDILHDEVSLQILPDGGPAEQSLGYHRFILDIYWLVLDFLKGNGLDLYLEFEPSLSAAERFLRTLSEGSYLPAIGDSDDGYAVAPGLYPKRTCPAISVHTARFLTSGYTAIRSPGMVFTFDHGRLGLAPLYNHGHADALSITLSLNGRGILVDPGTYRYNQAPEWRRYFKGTRAHNTVTIDGHDQAVQESGYIWSHPYRASLLHYQNSGEKIFLEAEHDGYARLRKPVTHKRSISFEKSRILIEDAFSGDGIHTFELNFHLHPDCQLSEKNEAWVIRLKEERIQMRLSNGGSFFSLKGEENPVSGWYSPKYGSKCESFVLRCIKEGPPREVSFSTVISL